MGGEPGEQHTWLYATDAPMDEVIAFYVAQGYSRQDEADWESFTQENFGVRIRRVVLVHPSTPFKFDARGLLLVFLERPYPRLKDFSDAPSPDNVVDRTGITITDLRHLR